MPFLSKDFPTAPHHTAVKGELCNAPQKVDFPPSGSDRTLMEPVCRCKNYDSNHSCPNKTNNNNKKKENNNCTRAYSGSRGEKVAFMIYGHQT